MLEPYCPYVRVLPLQRGAFPTPTVVVWLDGMGADEDTEGLRAFIRTSLPVQWLFPGIRAALASIGVHVLDEFVNVGEGWLAWVDLDGPSKRPDLAAVTFDAFMGVRNA